MAPSTRRLQRIQAWLVVVGGGSALSGLIVLLAWHLHWIAPTQVNPIFLLIRYSVALAFLLSGLLLLALVLAVKQKVRLKRLNQDLSQSNSLLRATLEATADGILVLDAQGRKINFNTRFIQMWQVPDGVLQSLRTGSDEQMMPFVLSQLQDPDAFQQATRRMMAQLEGDTFDVLEFKDGRVFERYSCPQWLGDRLVGRVLSFRDVTDRQTAVAEVAYSLAVTQATLESTADGIVVLDQFWNIIHYNQRFLELWQISQAEISEGDDRHLVKLMQAQLHKPEDFVQQIYDEYDTPTLSNQSIWTFVDGRVFERYSQPQWLGDDSVGRVVSYRDITDRLRAETALQEEMQRQSAVLAVQQEIMTHRSSLDATMKFIVEQTQQLTRASGAVIELVEGSELVYRAASGTAAGHIGLRLQIKTSFSGRCLETGEILYCRDSETDSRVNLAACRAIGVRSMIAVPLQHQGVRIGVLKVFAAIPSAFADRDRQTLQLMAGVLAAEISMALEFQAKQDALAALQESEERYRSVVSALSEGIVLQDAQGVICASNASAEQILGLSTEQMMGCASVDPSWQAIHEDGSPFPGQEHPSMVTLQTGQSCRGVIMGVCKPDGDLTWISINSQPLLHPGEALPYAVVASFTDITERKQAEILLRQSERRYRAIVEDQTELIARYLPNGILTFVNKAYCRYFGIAQAAIVGQPYEPVIFEDDRERVAQLVNSVCLENPVVVIENRVIVAGEVRWTQWINRGLFNLKGQLLELQAVGRDVTERRQAETALQDREALLRSVGDNLPNGAIYQFVCDAEGRGHFSYLSAGIERLTEVNAEDALSDPDLLFSQIIEEDRSGYQQAFAVSIRELSIFDCQIRIQTTSGKLKWFNFRTTPHLAEDGRVVGNGLVVDITDLKHVEESLRQSEEQLQLAFEASGDGLWDWNIATGAVYLSPRYVEMLGYAVGELPGNLSAWEGLVHPEDQPWVRERLSAHLQDQSVPYRFDYRVLTKSGQWKWIANYGKVVVWDEAGTPLRMTGVHRDIDDRKRIEQALFHEKELAQVTLQSIGDAVITTDAGGNIEYFNPVAESLTGWKQTEVRGLPLTDVFQIINEMTRQSVDNPVEQALRQNRIVELANHTLLIARNGSEIAIEDSAAPIHDRTGAIIGAVMVFHDVTQTRALSRQLIWQASHDALTGLVNRREFEQQLGQALSNAKLYQQKHALCYLDLDRFKIVNDTCGHAAGDELLQQVTALLQAQIRKTDTLARLGGDEFGVLLHQCPPEQALRVANAMRECLQAFRFVYQGQSFAIGASIGLVGVTAESESLASLLSSADAACYTAKNKGRNRVHVFQPDDEDLLQQRGEVQWVTRLTQALEDNCFCLYYQPIAAITDTGLCIDHYEVLLRLQDGQGNLISPMAFIPAAERYNLMHRIDRWVIRTLFSQWSTIASPGKGTYAINLSGASLNDEEFVGFLYEQFATYQIPPQFICFEITETVAIANLIKTNQLMRELQRIGCRFALDDFGSGMSSFGYLKNLSVDYLKIDGGFVKNIAADPVDAAMVEAITRIGHVMGIKTIAEFVENDAILKCVKDIGVDYAQGYGIAAPYPYVLN